MLKKLLFFLVSLLSINANCQYYKLSNQAKVSLITCGSGNELYSIYGHTAIRFLDSENNLDIVYNYGNFDFATESFYLKFVKGDLQYFVAACSFNDFMQEYIEINRNVFEQQLILSTDQKQKLYEQINSSMFSDERYYTYKFIDKNCTTMVLDKINAIYGSNVVHKKNSTSASYRTILYSYLNNHFWENFGINIIFGAKVDLAATKLFLPDELKLNLEKAKFNGQLIAKKAVVLNAKKIINSDDFSFWNSIYPYCIFLILLLIINIKSINLIYFLVLGLLGIFFSTVGFYSFHQEISNNYNVLLFNPSLLLLIYFLYKNNLKVIKYLCYFNLVSLLVYLIILLNKPHLLMMMPIVLTTIIILLRQLKTQYLLSTIK